MVVKYRGLELALEVGLEVEGIWGSRILLLDIFKNVHFVCFRSFC